MSGSTDAGTRRPAHSRPTSSSVTLEIHDDTMTLTARGCVIATATRDGDGWSVSTWPGRLSRNQAITALTIVERHAGGHGDDDPVVIALRRELPDG